MHGPENIDLFCRVVDNFGDVGVCWRLARQLVREHGIPVTLWIDELSSFQKICAGIDPDRDEQQAHGVTIRHWRDGMVLQAAADVVIEAFGCALPPDYVAAMVARKRPPVWINLEYLSAEPWVEGCHAMASRHPSLPLTKHFFFPGFSNKTGGLLVERDLIARRDAFQSDTGAMAAFFSGIGVPAFGAAQKVSLFCYPSAPVAALFAALQADAQPTVCLVPAGVAQDAVGQFLQQPAAVGACATRGALTVQVLPFVDQPDYDKLLWACDLNFVRGEDSFVRAQWAARPFVWQIYPQEENAHWPKLTAFLDRYQIAMRDDIMQTIGATWQAWNGAGDIGPAWRSLRPVLLQLSHHAAAWAGQLAQHGDLATNLVRYIQKIG